MQFQAWQCPQESRLCAGPSIKLSQGPAWLGGLSLSRAILWSWLRKTSPPVRDRSIEKAIIGQEMSETHVRWPINVTQGVTCTLRMYVCMHGCMYGLFFIAKGLLQKRISNFTPNGLQSLLVAYLNATPIYCQRAAISFIRIRAHCPGRVRPFPAPG